jgi:hypothetical protein
MLSTAACVAACAPPRSSAAQAQRSQDSVLVDGLFFIGRTQTKGGTPDTLAVEVELQNRRNVPLHLEYGACVLDPQLVRPGTATSRPAWALSARPDSSLRRRYDGTIGVLFTNACPAYLAIATLAPGERMSPKEFRWREGVDSIAADSLRGQYRVRARLWLLGRRFDVPAGALRLK